VKLTEKEVRHVADLANLALTDDEIGKMTHDLDGILTHIDKLNELDTSNIEPMIAFGAASANESTREDIEVPPLGNAAAIANAPLAGSGYFKVPKVIER
jgi:aspartyl-tRNA(Asn)/glutamyl-tRNA(Gln) amidotransferase subunit C